jgi:hypothetical protein
MLNGKAALIPSRDDRLLLPLRASDEGSLPLLLPSLLTSLLKGWCGLVPYSARGTTAFSAHFSLEGGPGGALTARIKRPQFYRGILQCSFQTCLLFLIQGLTWLVSHCARPTRAC